MNIKEQIGKRIEDERKAKGLTRKALAELTDDLKQSRINNWERGIRTPGPEEIKQLSKALEVSPAFLMCLTDFKHPHPLEKNHVNRLVPLLNHEEACDPESLIKTIKNGSYHKEISFIPLNPEFSQGIGNNTFAISVKDDSMTPEFRRGDILLVDPEKKIIPGCFVIAKIIASNEIVIRKYKQISTQDDQYELFALNDSWAKILIHKNEGKILGSVITLIRKI